MTDRVAFDQYELRELGAEYRKARNFIKHSWFSQYRAFKPAFVSHEVYREGQNRLIDDALVRATVRVATVPDAPDLFIGYVVRSGPVLHWVYVKQSFRRGQVADRLTAGVREYSHLLTYDYVVQWARRREWRYNPYALLEI